MRSAKGLMESDDLSKRQKSGTKASQIVEGKRQSLSAFGCKWK
jgi:hypothetical protein